MKKIIAAAAAVGLTLAGLSISLPAFADDSPPAPDPSQSQDAVTPSDTPTEPAIVVDTPAVVTPEVEAPAPSYVIVAWAMPSWINATTPSWPQVYETSLVEVTPDLSALDSQLTKCGTQHQVDIYHVGAISDSLIAGKHLDGPNNPAEDLISGGWGTAYKLIHNDACPPDYPKPMACASTTTLPNVNASNLAGWGDLQNGSFTDNGVQLTATPSQEAYAYVDFAGVPFTEMGDLSTVEDTQSGTWGVILQDSDGKSIHYDADGRYWSVHAGLFPETSPGFYSTYHPETDGELVSNPTITEVAVWVNPGGSILLHSQAYNCKIQPFAATPVATPPTGDLPGTPALAETGFNSTPFWVAAWLLLTSGFGALAVKRVLGRREA